MLVFDAELDFLVEPDNFFSCKLLFILKEDLPLSIDILKFSISSGIILFSLK